jgi:hypothetical protein
MLSLIVLSLTPVATPQSQWDLPGAPQQPGHTQSVEEAEAEAAAEAMEAGIDAAIPPPVVEEPVLASLDPLWAECEFQGRWYGLTARPLNWMDAEKGANELGGHLVTIANFRTMDWLKDHFGNQQLWIGLRRHSAEGLFTWSSGQNVAFRFWSWGRPDNIGNDENFVYMNENPFGEWNDGGGSKEPMMLRGIIELPHPPGDFDADGLKDDLEAVLETNPHDWDSDDDGISDADEHLGTLNNVKTDPTAWDTDGDGLSDGQECGLTTGIVGLPSRKIPGTNMAVFLMDADPSTTTNPVHIDTDLDGESDGSEDLNLDGKKDLNENDPLDPSDQGLLLESNEWRWGNLAAFRISGAEPGARLEVLLSTVGVDTSTAVDTLAGPLKQITVTATGTSGDITWALPLPIEAISQNGIWLQAIERGNRGTWRASPPIRIRTSQTTLPKP